MQVIGHLWRCTYGFSAYTVLIPSAPDGIGIRCQMTHALSACHVALAVCSMRVPARGLSSSVSTKYTSGKYLQQVETTDVSRKADKARARQTVKRIATLERGN